jgi:hypothetical protein
MFGFFTHTHQEKDLKHDQRTECCLYSQRVGAQKKRVGQKLAVISEAMLRLGNLLRTDHMLGGDHSKSALRAKQTPFSKRLTTCSRNFPMKGCTMKFDPCFYSFPVRFFYETNKNSGAKRNPRIKAKGAAAKWRGQKHSEGSRNESARVSWSESAWVVKCNP